MCTLVSAGGVGGLCSPDSDGVSSRVSVPASSPPMIQALGSALCPTGRGELCLRGETLPFKKYFY